MLLHCVTGLKEKIVTLVVRKLFPNGWRGILMQEMKLVCMAKTNADRIRAMSDEELRNWLFQRDCKNIAAFLQHGGAGVMNAAQLFDWLRQPVEEDDHAE